MCLALAQVGLSGSSHLCSPTTHLYYTHRVRIATPEIDGMLEIPVLVPQT